MKKLICLLFLLSGCGSSPFGIPGPQGQPGTPGVNGTSIVSTSVAAPTGSCGLEPNGSPISGEVVLMAQDTDQTGQYEANDSNQTSVLICNGTSGNTGAQGNPGPQGNSGTNSVTLTPVQLCSGKNPTYPSTFPEFGLCIGNQLYGVYSSNGGFLAELPPGEYSSDGVNASCSFTVGNNCEITPEN